MHDSIEVSLLGPEALKELCHASNPKILEAVKTDNKETLKWLLQQCPDLDINLSDLSASDTTPEDKSTTPNEVEGELYLCYWQYEHVHFVSFRALQGRFSVQGEMLWTIIIRIINRHSSNVHKVFYLSYL